MSWFMNTSTEAQMAWIMVQYGRSSRSSWTKPVRSSSGRTTMGKAVRESSIRKGWEKSSKLRMFFRQPSKRTILICACGWHKIGWKETTHWSDVEGTQWRSRFGRTNIFLWSWKTWSALKDNVKQAKILWTITEPCLNREFPRWTRKNTMFGKSSYLIVDPWRGGSGQEMCGTILWVATEKKGYSCLCMAGKKQNINPTWKILMKDVDFGEPTSYLDHVYLGCTHRECQISKIQDFSWSYGQTASFREIGCEHFFTVLRHGRSCKEMSVWKDIANWRTRQLNSYTESQHHASTTTNSKKKWDLLEDCLKFAHRLFWNVKIWLVLVDLIFKWAVNKLARAVTKWTKACDKRLARLISYIHHTCEIVGNTTQPCRLGLFQDSDFVGDL